MVGPRRDSWRGKQENRKQSRHEEKLRVISRVETERERLRFFFAVTNSN